MKIPYYIIPLIIIGCNNQHRQADQKTSVATDITTTQTKKNDNSKYYTKLYTITIITPEIGDTLKYGKADFNAIVDKHPELFQEYPDDPDQAYNCNSDRENFGSEVGQDSYYELYAYFLKQRNGVDKYAEQRKKLIDIYSNINSLFGYFQYGGTYFGHQSRRISGYAEYSIYLLPKKKVDIEKTYDIAKQKGLYIKSLRQLIEDESKIDFNTLLVKDKIERKKVLNKIVDELNSLITDNFYLRRAQGFQYEYYQYY